MKLAEINDLNNDSLRNSIYRFDSSSSTNSEISRLDNGDSKNISYEIYKDNSKVSQCISPEKIEFNKLLSNCVIFCDVKLNDCDRSLAIKIMIRLMGARIADELDDQVTHLIFRNGSQKSLKKAKQFNIKIVSILWLEAVRRNKKRVNETNYKPILETTKDVIHIDKFCHAIEEEYKQMVCEEFAQLNLCESRNNKNNSNIVADIQIDFEQDDLHKTIYDELEKSRSDSEANKENFQNNSNKNDGNNNEIYDKQNNFTQSSCNKMLEKNRNNDQISESHNESVNIHNVDKTIEIGKGVSDLMYKTITTTGKKKCRKLFTPGRHNSINVIQTPIIGSLRKDTKSTKRNYVPPYIPKLTDYKFRSLKKIRHTSIVKNTKRYSLTKINKPRKALKNNFFNSSSSSSTNTTSITKMRKEVKNSVKRLTPKSIKNVQINNSPAAANHSSAEFQSPVIFAKNQKQLTQSMEVKKMRKNECIVVTHLEKQKTLIVMKAIKILGRFHYEVHVTDKTTHIISSGQRTLNFLLGLINGCWILNYKWIEESLKANKWLSEEEFEMVELNENIKKRRIERQILGESHNMNLFHNYRIFLGKFEKKSLYNDFEVLISKCGGNLVSSPLDANIIIGSCEIQLTNAQFVNNNWILDSITSNKTMSIRRKYLQTI